MAAGIRSRARGAGRAAAAAAALWLAFSLLPPAGAAARPAKAGAARAPAPAQRAPRQAGCLPPPPAFSWDGAALCCGSEPCSLLVTVQGPQGLQLIRLQLAPGQRQGLDLAPGSRVMTISAVQSPSSP